MSITFTDESYISSVMYLAILFSNFRDVQYICISTNDLSLFYVGNTASADEHFMCIKMARVAKQVLRPIF